MGIERKKRIAVIGLKGLPAFGGAATVGESIINQLKDEYDFTVYAVASHTQKSGNFEGYNQIVFKIFPIKKLNVLFYYIKSMIHCLFRAKYDLIHLHHLDGAFIMPFLRLKYKVLSTSHGRTQLISKWPGYVKFFFTINERLMLGLANKLTAVARPLAELYSKMGFKNVTYVPNGINLNQPIDNKPIPYSDYILFAAGRIIPLKGCHIMLEALKLLSYKGKVLIIGDLDQIPDYKEKILGLAQGLDVVFVPLIREKHVLLNYVKNARLFIFPSDYENMSIMLLEVAFTMTPLICSDIVQNRAIFSDKEVLFFKTNDPGDLRDKISFALENAQRMNEQTKDAYSLLKSEYNWEVIAKTYDSLYKQLIK